MKAHFQNCIQGNIFFLNFSKILSLTITKDKSNKPQVIPAFGQKETQILKHSCVILGM